MASIERVDIFPADWSLADVQRALGEIPPERIRVAPPLGTAKPDDVLRIAAEENRQCELVDGVLVEKTVGWYESLIAIIVAREIGVYLNSNPLGKVLGADGALQIMAGMVRIPDVCFISWGRFPNQELPAEPIPAIVPDLAVEVLSVHNTDAEMHRKIRDYFGAGIRLVWYIDPRDRNARVYSSEHDVELVELDGVLDGSLVLPGFQLSLRNLFSEADRTGPES